MEDGWAVRPRSPPLEPIEADGSHITVEVNSTLLHTAGTEIVLLLVKGKKVT